MKKKILALSLALLIFTTLSFPASATDACHSERKMIETVAAEAGKASFKKDVTNEYDYIIDIRGATEKELITLDIPSEEVEYIKSNSIETELLYRASLPSEVLRSNYCYSDEAIQILRTYDGTRLEENPRLRAVTATLSASLGSLVYTDIRMGAIYTWEWDTKPLILLTDYVAIAWEGTYTNGGNNNVALDLQTSFSNVTYYYSNTNKKIVNYDIDSGALYRGASINFPMEKYFNAWYYWAKSGSMFIYMDLANVNGPKIYELAAHAEYAHYTLALPLPSVSYPAGISISFEGVLDVLGSKNIRIRAQTN